MHTNPRRSPAYPVALGGILAALAVTVMTLGGLIPIATYVSPMVCMILLQVILNHAGKRMALAWFLAVSILSTLLSPDKEAAAVFLVLGTYPVWKIRLDRSKLSCLWKGLWFNLLTLLLYWVLIRILGLPQVTSDLEELNTWMLLLLLGTGNFTFFTLDRLLGMPKIQRLGRNER